MKQLITDSNGVMRPYYTNCWVVVDSDGKTVVDRSGTVFSYSNSRHARRAADLLGVSEFTLTAMTLREFRTLHPEGSIN